MWFTLADTSKVWKMVNFELEEASRDTLATDWGATKSSNFCFGACK